MFGNESYPDQSAFPPAGICDECYVSWKEFSGDRFTGSIFCPTKRTCALLHHSGEWVVLHSVTDDDYRREQRNYYRDLKTGVLARLNKLLTPKGTAGFLAEETDMEEGGSPAFAKRACLGPFADIPTLDLPSPKPVHSLQSRQRICSNSFI